MRTEELINRSMSLADEGKSACEQVDQQFRPHRFHCPPGAAHRVLALLPHSGAQVDDEVCTLQAAAAATLVHQAAHGHHRPLARIDR